MAPEPKPKRTPPRAPVKFSKLRRYMVAPLAGGEVMAQLFYQQSAEQPLRKIALRLDEALTAKLIDDLTVTLEKARARRGKPH